MLRLQPPARALGCAAAVLLAACGASLNKSSAGPSGSGGGGDHGVGACFQDSDCPAGLVCKAQACVASDGLPPEQKDPGVFQEPKTSQNFVFALSPDNDSIAVIDPATLAIRSIDLPHEPFGIEVVPGQDAAVIVARAGRMVSYLACDARACTLQSQATARHYPAVAVSGDGKWALLWTPDPAIPDQGAEGVVGVVDLQKLAAGTPAAIVERATGRRNTNAFFRMEQGVAVDAVVLAEDDLAVLPLADLGSTPLPLQVALPSDYTAVASRQAVAAPDGAMVLVRSYASHDLGALDVSARSFHRLTMPGTPSDLALTQDGHTAVVVLRDVGQVGLLSLPAALTDPNAVQFVNAPLPADLCGSDGGTCTVFPGQASLSPDGRRAALFTNAEASKSFAVLDLATGQVAPFTGLDKWIQTLGIGPDGNTLIALHRPNPASTAADSYQRMVDQSEGYSVVDLTAGFAQLKLTQKVPPQQFVFASDGAHAAVTLSDTAHAVFAVDDIDLQTLVTSSLALASRPQYAGAFAGDTPLVWVTQDHPAGRISFVDLSTEQVRTATGYALNSGISP